MPHVETTHAVENQPPLLMDYDAFARDQPLVDCIAREGAPWVAARLASYGRWVGGAEAIELGYEANRHPPELRTHDRYGHRIDEVHYHPAYHRLMAQAMEAQVHAIAWTHRGPGAQVAHAALLYLHAQAEAGSCCPLTMTHAAVPALRVSPALTAVWEPRVLAATYDGRNLPLSTKRSATLGMAMTEKQGGSDVRANSTRAHPLGREGELRAFSLHGHKWFCSAPMSDAFLTLAQSDGGLSCFLVPRFLPDGSRNRILIQRLKDKLGNRSNASSEIEYDRTTALLVGEEGRGVQTILQMVAQTRVDCAAGSAGLMRQALVQAIHHARHRAAFGARLVEQPLMLRVLADMALEVEAATALSLRVARAYDELHDPRARLLARGATAIAKYWITHRAPGLTFEAMECLGGAGYVEESGMPRLYREAPVNSIWEGSGNVQCLDVLRALHREPALAAALIDEIGQARGGNALLDLLRTQLERELADHTDREAGARRLVERLAIALSASLLVRFAPPHVADGYCAARIGPDRGAEYGALPHGIDVGAIVDRAWAP